MLYFQTWKVVLILAVCAIGVLFSIPNLVPASQLAQWPRWIPHKQVSLGLDLQGGSHLLLEVDMDSVVKEQLNNLVDELRAALVAQKIGYTGLEVQGDHVALTLREPNRLEDVRAAVQKINADLVMTSGENGAISIKQSDLALQARRGSAVDQSIEIVRRRIDETGTKEANIQKVGEDRILVQLPGVENPEHVKELLGKTAKMTFQLVDTNASVEDARRGKLPPGDVLLPAENGARQGMPSAYVVRRRVMVSGDTLTDAQPSFNSTNQPVVSFKFDSTGARRFADATRENVGKPFAIVLDNKVISAPNIREPILGGSGIIEGGFTVQTANDLALLLRAGALPAPLTILEERTVGPDLGADSIHAGALASIVGIVLVIVFMVIFYGLFGLFADVALFFNLCIMMAVLSLFNATLTLPGIAGIALTLGMAVDANVLIYERIRDEAHAGRTPIMALEHGYQRALVSIIDANITSAISAIIMFQFGSGPIRGFAWTLLIGVFTSVFTAVIITQLLIGWWFRATKPRTLPIE